MPHIIWDWNGTLFDDLAVVVQSVNAALDRFGMGPIDADEYRDHYTRPVHLFYEELLGRETSRQEWEMIDETFHQAYRSRLDQGALAPDALVALRAVAKAGETQSLLSMWWHDQLVPMAKQLGVDRYMARIDGLRGEGSGDTKTAHLQQHLQALTDAGLHSDPVVVGDSLDDATAAAALNVAAVLYDGGSHHREKLEATGFPVAGTLTDALPLAGM